MTAQVVLVTGPAGAGRTTAIAALEDLGFETIDNMPLSLVPRLFDGPDLTRPLALGLDPRNRDFSAGSMAALVSRLRLRVGIGIVFLDCRTDVLMRRFSETRRRHPTAPTDDPGVGVEREIALLDPIRGLADITIDTSDMSPRDLRGRLMDLFGAGESRRMAISVQSFAYKRGMPQGLDLVVDVRFLRNPHWVDGLRPLDGHDSAVAAYVAGDLRYREFMARFVDLGRVLLPGYVDEGKAHVSVGFGCTGGQHRSVAVAEAFAAALAEEGWQVSTRHRELERLAAAAVRQTG